MLLKLLYLTSSHVTQHCADGHFVDGHSVDGRVSTTNELQHSMHSWVLLPDLPGVSLSIDVLAVDHLLLGGLTRTVIPRPTLPSQQAASQTDIY
jgi:hypothetical protein